MNTALVLSYEYGTRVTMSNDKTYEAWEFMKEHIIIIPVGFPPPEKTGGEE